MICDQCNYFTSKDHRRQYNGRDVCVSCLIDLKLDNNEYSNG